MNRFALSLLAVLLLPAMLFAGADSEPATDSAPLDAPPSEPVALRFGTLPAVSAIPIVYAVQEGYFADEGVDVQVIPFLSPNDRNVALQTDQIDAFVGDIMTAITFRGAGFPVVVTSTIVEDFKLLASPQSGITEVAGLNGRTVSLVPGFVLEYIMDEIALDAGITYETVIIPSIPARFEALLSGQIDAVLFTEPQASLLAAAGAPVLAGSNEKGINAGAMIFRAPFVSGNADAVSAFYRGYNRAVTALNGTDIAELSELLAANGFPPDVAARVRGPLVLQPAAAIPSATIEDVAAWMVEKGADGPDLQGLTSFEVLPGE